MFTPEAAPGTLLSLIYLPVTAGEMVFLRQLQKSEFTGLNIGTILYALCLFITSNNLKIVMNVVEFKPQV